MTAGGKINFRILYIDQILQEEFLLAVTVRSMNVPKLRRYFLVSQEIIDWNRRF